VVPLPRAWLLTGALLVGTAVGMVAAIAATLVIHIHLRPDVAIALVVGVLCMSGLVLVLLTTGRWMTTVGAFLLAVGPGTVCALLAAMVNDKPLVSAVAVAVAAAPLAVVAAAAVLHGSSFCERAGHCLVGLIPY
jgi:hypothetical protein